MPTIDVLVPCYNYGRYLRDCVRSILTQQGCDIRVLVIDDASADETAMVAHQLAAEDPRVDVIVHDVNRGHIATYNEGIAWSSADYFLLLSADDMLLPGALASAIGVMEQHPDLAWAYGREIELHPGDTPDQAMARSGWAADAAPDWRITPGTDLIARICRSARNHVPTCTAVVRGSAQRRIGGYRPELPHAGDLEMWLRLSSLGAVAESDCFLGIRRLHASNMFREYPGVHDLRQRQAAFDSFLAQEGRGFPASAKWRRLVRRGLANSAARWGITYIRHGHIRLGLDCLGFAFRLHPVSAAMAPLAYLKRLWPGSRGTARPYARPANGG